MSKNGDWLVFMTGRHFRTLCGVKVFVRWKDYQPTLKKIYYGQVRMWSMRLGVWPLSRRSWTWYRSGHLVWRSTRRLGMPVVWSGQGSVRSGKVTIHFKNLWPCVGSKKSWLMAMFIYWRIILAQPEATQSC